MSIEDLSSISNGHGCPKFGGGVSKLLVSVSKKYNKTTYRYDSKLNEDIYIDLVTKYELFIIIYMKQFL